MRQFFATLIVSIGLGACTDSRNASIDPKSALAPGELKSAYAFLTPETQALQDDPFANPGYLWVDRGAALFSNADGVEKSCKSCHFSGLSGASVTYPKVDKTSGTLLNLEGQVNRCRAQHQEAAPFAYESEELLALTAYVAEQSRGLPLEVDITGAAEPHFETGRDYFFTRRGQFNLSCHQCHDQNWGKQLRGDTISQGHGNGFPAYRFEWQSLGSLHRRFKDCDLGVRAEPYSLGSEVYTQLELYLAARATGLKTETPAVRR